MSVCGTLGIVLASGSLSCWWAEPGLPPDQAEHFPSGSLGTWRMPSAT